MTSTTMTIYDPEGEPYAMEWCADLEAEAATWCDLCDAVIEAGWIDRFDDAGGVFVVCDDCALANAIPPARAYGITREGAVEHAAADFPFE